MKRSRPRNSSRRRQELPQHEKFLLEEEEEDEDDVSDMEKLPSEPEVETESMMLRRLERERLEREAAAKQAAIDKAEEAERERAEAERRMQEQKKQEMLDRERARQEAAQKLISDQEEAARLRNIAITKAMDEAKAAEVANEKRKKAAINQQRFENSSHSHWGRTKTRSFPGRPATRWHEGVQAATARPTP